MKLNPPDSLKAFAHCSFRLEDGTCCHALNNFRPHTCNRYCIPSLEVWLREKYPDIQNDEIQSIVEQLSPGKGKANNH